MSIFLNPLAKGEKIVSEIDQMQILIKQEDKNSGQIHILKVYQE